MQLQIQHRWKLQANLKIREDFADQDEDEGFEAVDDVEDIEDLEDFEYEDEE